ncbi:MAG: DNA mismatch repair endonuclease MutL [Bacteroidales bacterium]|nr:DNA mismatch repair endonuclease MutL [Bacteroidales bacterium]
MTDIIHLLPDSVANQIAAGEVIQRPSSAVKELLENAIDAGATEIKVIIKDAGKTLIQVIDNGCGMSGTDARMCFERHATSKIKTADDIFEVRTMGFRGEALPSIAAISQVELKTKRIDDDMGAFIIIEGSEVVKQENCSCNNGTSISIKNLFYNTPARRKFLKNDAIEISHIIEEFQRVALINHDIAFTLHSNNKEIFHLERNNLKQRIISIFGSGFNNKILPLEEETTIAKFYGFIGKPEFAKAKRGEQYFFVNNRFVKHPYLHHAVQKSFHDLIQADKFPSYFINIVVNPKTVDVNIHPTKTEVKFEDEKIMYSLLLSAIRQVIGKFHLAPMLDFQAENISAIPYIPGNTPIVNPGININPGYNPFVTEKKAGKKNEEFASSKSFHQSKQNLKNWDRLYQGAAETKERTETAQQSMSPEKNINIPEVTDKNIFQLHNKYILAHVASGLMVVDQQAAHERILYEKFLNSFKNHTANSQQLLFPKTIELSPADFEIVSEIKKDLREIGFEIGDFGKNSLIVHGVPVEVVNDDIEKLFEEIIGQYKINSSVYNAKHENLAASLAKKVSVKYGKALSQEEMLGLIEGLFSCGMPGFSPSGKITATIINIEEIDDKFSTK